MSEIINLDNVKKTYDIKGGQIQALRGVSLNADKGDFMAVVGPSGSGKSTLINMVTGIDRPTEGEVYVAGQRLTNMNEDQVAEWRGHNVGVVFQFFQLLPSLTVMENIMMPMIYGKTYKGKRQARALEVLDMVGMADYAEKYPGQLSGGQQQRSAIARALVNDPTVIVGDEPTGNLDVESANIVFNLFQELVNQGRTIVMVTHDKDLAAKVPRIVEVRAGEVLTDDAIDTRLLGKSNGRIN